MREDRQRYYRFEAERGSFLSADYNQEVLASLYASVPVEGVGTVADLGSGIGKNLPLLRRSFPGAVFVTVDLNAQGLRCGYTSGRTALIPTVADVLCLPLRRGAVDLVVCTEVLEHVADLNEAGKEFSRVVRPDGHCIISSPNYLNPMGLRKWCKDHRFGNEFWDPWDGHTGFERLMTPRLLRRALEKYFRIRAVRGAGFIMAWTALGYRRVGGLHDRYPAVGLGRWPVLKHVAMNRYLLLQRRGDS